MALRAGAKGIICLVVAVAANALLSCGRPGTREFRATKYMHFVVSICEIEARPKFKPVSCCQPDCAKVHKFKGPKISMKFVQRTLKAIKICIDQSILLHSSVEITEYDVEFQPLLDSHHSKIKSNDSIKEPDGDVT